MRTTQKAQEALERILEAFETGDVPEALATALLPRFDVPSNQWSLNNRVLMFLSGTSDARGIHQWRTMGRHPRKGSRAFCILVPMHATRTEKDEDTGQEKKRQLLVGFKCAPVFAYEVTDGQPIDRPDLEPPQPPPLSDVAEAWSIKVDYLPGNEKYFGFYQPGQSRIGLSTHKPQVFFHELAHAAHHRVLGILKGGQDWRQEVVAELTAATLSKMYGEQPDEGGAYRYIREYAERAGKDVHAACMSVISDVGKCLEKILSTAEALQPEAIAAD